MMTTSNSARDLRGSREGGLTTKRRQAGTTLVEILVVIVIFLIGILAVVQIFPRGFRLLLTSRNNSVATALGRDEVARLTDHPDLLPEAVLPVRYMGPSGTPVVDNTLNPYALGPTGDRIFADGKLWAGSSIVANDWELASGPNIARRIIGEGQRIPAPRRIDLENKAGLDSTDKDVMSSYGSLMVLDHGPVDPNVKAPIVAYANDLSRSVGEPRETVDETNTVTVGTYTADGATSLGSLTGVISNTPVATAPFEYFVANADQGRASILFPATYNFARTYRIRMSAYVGTAASYVRNDYLSLCISIPKVANGKSFVRVYLDDILKNTPGAEPSGAALGSVELDTIRVAPLYVQRTDWTSRATVATTDPAYVSGDYTPIDPFEVKIVNRALGTLLFSPAARQGVITRPGGVSEPLIAKVDYDVLDWRILREDFRVTGSPTFSLSLQSLKVATQRGPDGRVNGGMSASFDPANVYDVNAGTDNVAIIDLTTGFQLQEFATDGTPFVRVDKSRGAVTFLDSTPGDAALTVRLVGLSGRTLDVDPFNRTFRVLYRARNEWAVQLFKAVSQYTAVNSFTVGAGQYYVGGASGTVKTRVYFPTSDARLKVTIDRVTYIHDDGSGAQLRTLEGQDFVIKPTRTGETSLASIDLTDVDKYATAFVGGQQAVRGVKGASVSVRVLWNPDAFTLTDDQADNVVRADQWGRGWRPSITETFLRAEETR